MSRTVVNVKSDVQAVLNELENKNIRNIFFVACGGSSAIMYPAKYVLDREATTLTSDLYSSNEFIHRNPRQLGKESLVILCSMSGTTPETAEAATFAKNKGAYAVALTNEPTSPLAQNADSVIKYEWGNDVDAFETNLGVLYQLVFGVLSVVENNGKFAKAVSSLENLQSVYEKALQYEKENARKYAEANKEEPVIYTMASGANYGAAYSFSICILMEMQWIHSHAIHAGEYFHGPFEIIDENVPFMILLGLDETRPLEERALSFSKRYGKKLTVLDAKEYDLSGIDEEMKGYIAPLILNRVLRQYAEELAEARNHPLSKRRYMWKVEY